MSKDLKYGKIYHLLQINLESFQEIAISNYKNHYKCQLTKRTEHPDFKLMRKERGSKHL